MTFLTRHDRLLAIVGTAALTIGFLIGVMRPVQLAAQSMAADISQLQTTLAALPHKMAAREEQRAEQLTQQREQARKMEALVPSDAGVSDVLDAVAELARESQVSITRWEPLPQNGFASYSTHPFLLSCKGEFRGLTKFLSGLETQPRLVTFGELSLTRGANSPDRQVLANIRFNVYSRHSNSARTTGNANSPIDPSSDN